MNRFRVAQKILLFNKKGEVLIVRFASIPQIPRKLHKTWDFPGGGLEWRETLSKGLAREVKEEVGPIEYTQGKPILAWDWRLLWKDQIRCVCLLYEGKFLSGKISLNEEHDMFTWVQINKLSDYRWASENSKVVKSLQKMYVGKKTS